MTQATDYKESPCRSCGTLIVWMVTKSGKRMPVDATSAKFGDKEFDHTRHVSHFATCPNANQHRKPKEVAA